MATQCSILFLTLNKPSKLCTYCGRSNPPLAPSIWCVIILCQIWKAESENVHIYLLAATCQVQEFHQYNISEMVITLQISPLSYYIEVQIKSAMSRVSNKSNDTLQISIYIFYWQQHVKCKNFVCMTLAKW